MRDSNTSVDSGANPDTSTNLILMIACICRNISESDYHDLKSLLKRLEQEDVQCSKCIDYYRGVIQVRHTKKGYQENSEEAT